MAGSNVEAPHPDTGLRSQPSVGGYYLEASPVAYFRVSRDRVHLNCVSISSHIEKLARMLMVHDCSGVEIVALARARTRTM